MSLNFGKLTINNKGLRIDDNNYSKASSIQIAINRIFDLKENTLEKMGEFDNPLIEERNSFTQGDVSDFKGQQQVAFIQNELTIASQEFANSINFVSQCQSALSGKQGALQSAQNALGSIPQTTIDEKTGEEIVNSQYKSAQEALATAQAEYNQALQDLQQAQQQANDSQARQLELSQALAEINQEDKETQDVNSDTEYEVLKTSVQEYDEKIAELQQQLQELLKNNQQQDAASQEKEAPQQNQEAAIQSSMMSDMQAQIAKMQSELETTKNSKTGFGAALDFAAGIFGKGTKGELNNVAQLQEALNALGENPDIEQVKALYAQIFNQEPDMEAYQKSVEIQEALSDDNKVTLSNGQTVSREDIAKEVLSQATSLSANFDDSIDSRGVFTTIASGINSFFGIGTTRKMTEAQIDNFENLAQQLSQAQDPEEFASLYKAITGEDLSQESLDELFGGESKVDNSKAAETIMDYEESCENTKNTAVAIGVGIATAATGPIGAIAIGVEATVGVNAIDAMTKDHGQNIGENLINYAKTDLLKDVLVGGLNAFTGKVGNMTGDFLVKQFASKTGVLVSEQAAMKAGLSFGQRAISEFADGAIDAGLSSAGEYIIDAAAGENGNFTDDEGVLAILENLEENFDAQEMFEQVVTSTLMGGAMSVGMQEGMSLIGSAFSKNTQIQTANSDFSNIKSGEIFNNPQTNKLALKLKDGTIKDFEISQETFKKLFPRGTQTSLYQGQVGDCYLVAGVYTLLSDSRTAGRVLDCFTECADGSLKVKLPAGSVEFTLPKGKSIADFTELNKLSTGSDGVKLLEYVYGLNLVSKKSDSILEEIGNMRSAQARVNSHISLAEQIKNGDFTDVSQILAKIDELELGDDMKIGDLYPFAKNNFYLEFLANSNGEYKIDLDVAEAKIMKSVESFNNIESKIAKLNDELSDLSDTPAKEIELRGQGGHTSDVFKMFGLDSDMDTDMDSCIQILLQKDNWLNCVFAAGTKGDSDTKFLNKTLDIAGRHAYAIKPKLNEAGEVVLDIINPWHTNKFTTITMDQFKEYFNQLHIAMV